MRYLEICLPEAVPGLLALMGEHDGQIIWGAAQVINIVKCNEQGVDDLLLRRLCEMTVHDGYGVRQKMIWRLEDLSEVSFVDPDRAMHHYRIILEEDPSAMEDLDHLYRGVNYLVNGVTSNDEEVIDDLVYIIDCNDYRVSKEVALKVKSLTNSYTRVIDRLIEILGDPDPLSRETACKVLKDLGPLAQRALPALEDLYQNDTELKWEAQSAIRYINGP